MKAVKATVFKLLAAAVLASELLPAATALPKTPWARQRVQSHSRRLLGASLDKRGEEPKEDCMVKSALDIDAPKENIWGGLSQAEAAGVAAWLFAQGDLNLTASEDAGSWDNTL